MHSRTEREWWSERCVGMQTALLCSPTATPPHTPRTHALPPHRIALCVRAGGSEGRGCVEDKRARSEG
eukprot:1265094-Rhodomonas_salina.1